ARLAEQAEALNVPDSAFSAGETRPWQMSLEVNRAMVRREGVIQASGVGQAVEPRYPVAQGIYNPATDTTKLVPAATTSQQSVLTRTPPVDDQSAAQPNPLQPKPGLPNGGPLNPVQPTPGQRLFQEGLQALIKQDRQAALQKFTEAWKFQDQLDPDTRQQ